MKTPTRIDKQLRRKALPRPKCIYVDVDGTLIIGGRVNSKLVVWLKTKAQQDYDIVVWSAQGREHAEEAVVTSTLEGYVRAALSKPGYIVDDAGWSWTRHMQALPPGVAGLLGEDGGLG